MQKDLISLCKDQDYGTDKIDNGYGNAYEFHFSRFRDRPVTIMEIGVFTGSSLNLWSDYFHPESVIVGLDINRPLLPLSELRKNIKFFQGDATDRYFISSVLGDHTPDIVIDDGSHLSSQINKTFELLWPFVKSLYVVEDLGTQFKDRHQGSYVDTDYPFSNYVHLLSRGLMRHERQVMKRVCVDFGQVYIYKS